ncbi:hypothetical protein [Bosea sp. UNC402CLCol]|uniref:hypothetical protein n=1 Tax=Bosea sp. UNC402CLCol TaxID=1510531 RepID=UPI00068F6920|nr:hypothetical protein [Bosea sp. UNC402CLCol]
MANEFLPFAATGGANVISQADYAALAARLAGFVNGIALPEQANKAWRQSAAMAAMIGQFTADRSQLDALDNGDLATLQAHFELGLRGQSYSYIGVVGGTANAITASFSPANTDYAQLVGAPIRIVPGGPNTGAATLNVNGLGAKAIVRNDNGAALEGGEMLGTCTLIYDGTSFRLQAVPRLRTPRVTVPSGGVTVTAANEYTTYVMDLSVRQVFTLPAASSVPVGFRCTLETSNSPSGFQTAYVNATGGGNLFYRAAATATFYLIGGGEVFEFVNTGTQWLIRLVSQPGLIGIYRTATSQPATVAVSTSFGNVNVDTNAGTPGVFQLTSATITVPVSGVYNVVAGVNGYNNVAAWDNLDVSVFNNTSGLVSQGTSSLAIFNSFAAKPKLTYTQYYPQGTILLIGVRAAGGSGIINGNASEFSVFLTGR